MRLESREGPGRSYSWGLKQWGAWSWWWQEPLGGWLVGSLGSWVGKQRCSLSLVGCRWRLRLWLWDNLSQSLVSWGWGTGLGLHSAEGDPGAWLQTPVQEVYRVGLWACTFFTLRPVLYWHLWEQLCIGGDCLQQQRYTCEWTINPGGPLFLCISATLFLLWQTLPILLSVIICCLGLKPCSLTSFIHPEYFPSSHSMYEMTSQDQRDDSKSQSTWFA